MRGARALYAAFDRFPSRKGSAVHIDRFARALFERSGGGLLYVLGGEGLPSYQREGDVEIVRYMREADHVLERAAGYGARLSALLDELPDLEIAHFRDPWSGLPIVEHDGDHLKVYEVNGLPSIELPFLYPAIPNALLEQIAEMELRCLHAADLVITPSQVTADRLPVPAHVVPNGAELRPRSERPALDRPYLLYFGALQPWQGVDTALRAVARLELDLVICASVHQRRAKPYRKLAEKLGIEARVHWHFALPEEELAPWRDHALLSLAPLRDCSRNAVQGCAPLKILESMAAGVPVVASDLPAVRELLTDGVHGRLVAPDRPGELARAIRVLLDYPEERERMGAAARAHVQAHLTWDASVARLQRLYGERMPAWPTA
ncbi:glycosyltransferase family 4 protein [Solirubrobacter phytolaccae]|uniref:Glycosyltransferase family 4 protein n=1 Tax=Solirubrobacter phytolaccae TaxID=1404360 RepID=A0A9X3SA07_9ACTN|nr:glycosyltransferase family 4 protein [Solirubrobacter phytolaccae]MDA0183153.1 glycosyltransferase family 4 protein [Solirubrobacter phytolaccae]